MGRRLSEQVPATPLALGNRNVKVASLFRVNFDTLEGKISSLILREVFFYFVLPGISFVQFTQWN